jgi:D-amino-acid dehydrogenase
MTSIAIIGAGVTGVTTAYKLLGRGLAVTVFDRQRYAAMETSFANGGQLSASHAEVWNQPSTLIKGLRWLLRKDAPLLINPVPSWHKISWLMEFAAACRHYRHNTQALTQLALASRRHLLDMAETEGIEFDLVKRGILQVYEDAAEFKAAGRVTSILVEAGLDRRAVTPDEIRSIEPSLNGRFHAGFYTASDFTGDIHTFTTALAAACEQKGVRFHYEADVVGLQTARNGVDVVWRLDGETAAERHHFDAVVVCAGVASRRFAAMLGDRVNVYPVKGYSITVDLGDRSSQDGAPWVSLLDENAKIVTSRLGLQRLRIAGTAELAGENRDIRAARIAPLTNWLRSRFPGVSTQSVHPWAGLRPMTPTMVPRVGAGRRPGVFYNTGHGHLGWTLCAITAEMVACDVVGHATDCPEQRAGTHSL